MNKTQQPIPSKKQYEAPNIDVIKISCADIITTSGIGDENQGEWDPQFFDDQI